MATLKDSYYYRKLNPGTSLIADLMLMVREVSMGGDPICFVISRNNLEKFRETHPFFEYEKSPVKAKLGSAFRLKDARKSLVFFSDKITDDIAYGFFNEKRDGGFSDFPQSLRAIISSPVLDVLYDGERLKKVATSLGL